MFYLIGGPPKCGKTTLAKKIAKKHKIPWLSTDTLHAIIRENTKKEEIAKKFPYAIIKNKLGTGTDKVYENNTSQEIINWYRASAKSIAKAIDTFIICEKTDGHDYVIEGLHIEPKLAHQIQKKYGRKNFKVIFLSKTDPKKFISGIQKSKTHNDWILTRTKDKKTYPKISKMICKYGKFFEREAKKYGFKVINMDDDFDKKIQKNC
ncbi:AAA family ATPase [Patescibacteria group bacterium]